MSKRKLTGISIVVLGIVLAAALLAFQYAHCVHMWTNECKADEFRTAVDYFFEVSTGAVMISALIALFAAYFGIYLCCSQKQ